MIISTPPDVVRRIPLDSRDTAVREFAQAIAGIRPAAAADLEALAGEAVDAALREGAVLLAVVEPQDAAPALLTGVPLDAPPSWDQDSAEALRDSVEDLAGPDVRETVVVETGLGPAVIAQRVPGPEQVRDRRPLTLQLQAFIPEPGTGRMLLLTLACPSLTGWAAHQQLFGQIVAAAGPGPAEWDTGFGPVGFTPALAATGRPPAPAIPDPTTPDPAASQPNPAAGAAASQPHPATAIPASSRPGQATGSPASSRPGQAAASSQPGQAAGAAAPSRPGPAAEQVRPAVSRRPRGRPAVDEEESFEHHTFRLT
ncbi:hypothetical protein [Actinokineospora spheciospongiae]|uniref:hypothetical protein n=1 Tax=Actinokineospora spheciospongiae TaxID=909613 RepID=UPI000D71487F|nr:hypothetical protein [Actinokineospora spheciospongiae]PWW55449.1 hypothetical protein DFQ13_112103 [Actinokineospora spheciospongiae]